MKSILIALMMICSLSACAAETSSQPKGDQTETQTPVQVAIVDEGSTTVNAGGQSQVAIADDQGLVAANVGGNAQVVVNGKVFSRSASYSSQVTMNGVAFSGNSLSLSSSDGKIFVNGVEVPENFSGILKTPYGDVLVER